MVESPALPASLPALLATALDTTSEMVFILDPDGRYRYVNGAAAAALGWAADHVLGRTWRELGIADEAMAEYHAQRGRVLASGQPVTYASEGRLQPGRWFEYVLSRIPPDIAPGCVLVTVRDVTPRPRVPVAMPPHMARAPRDPVSAPAMRSNTEKRDELCLDPLVLTGRRTLRLGERSLSLTPTEIRVLRLLAAAAGNLVTRATLVQEVWGQDDPDEPFSDRALNMQVSRLRRKLRTLAPEAPTIKAVRGLGYRLAQPRS